MGAMINWIVYALAPTIKEDPRIYEALYFPLLGFCVMFIVN